MTDNQPDNQPDIQHAAEIEAEPEAQPRVPRIDILIALFLVLATVGVYSRVWQNGFVNFDDNSYVFDNPHIRGEMTSDNVLWAFASGYPDNWFPVTRLSHMLDYQLFGPNAGVHHLINLTIHVCATVLLFVFLRLATGVRWPCAVVAFLFALHPLHVESVAWVAERKDVLCAFFWFPTLLAWIYYVARPSVPRYLLALVLFGLGLMSKPMMVTLPILLLLLDRWPLRRPLSIRLLWEKLPFAALSFADALATYLVQKSIGAVVPSSITPWGLRVENALLSVVVYAWRMLWPAHLGVLYPYPASIPVWQAAMAGLAIAGVTFLVVRLRHNYTWLAFGWFWYLVTLAPVIGLIQVGAQSRADRYTYVPMVGLSIMLAWSGAELLRRWPKTKTPVTAIGAIAAVAMAGTTWVQISYWKNTEALFRRSISVAPDNYLAWDYLAGQFADRPSGIGEAISDYQTSIRLRPDFVEAHNGLGVALYKLGLVSGAMAEYREALKIYPSYPEAHYDLGCALISLGRTSEGIAELETAIRVNSQFTEAHNELGAALLKVPGRSAEAIRHLEVAVRINPDYGVAQNNLGMALVGQPGRLPEAIEHFRKAIKISPSYLDARTNLGIALLRFPDRVPEAIHILEGVLRIKPDPDLRRQLNRIEDAEQNRGR